MMKRKKTKQRQQPFSFADALEMMGQTAVRLPGEETYHEYKQKEREYKQLNKREW